LRQNKGLFVLLAGAKLVPKVSKIVCKGEG